MHKVYLLRFAIFVALMAMCAGAFAMMGFRDYRTVLEDGEFEAFVAAHSNEVCFLGVNMYSQGSVYHASALGVNVELLFEPRAESKAALSQSLVYRIAGLIEKLKGLVPDPEKFQASADDFAGRALFPVLRVCNA